MKQIKIISSIVLIKILEWLVKNGGYLKCNPQILLRTPENISFACAQAFNKNNINCYFIKLSAIMEQYKFPPENIYNVDKSDLSTVQKRPQKYCLLKGENK